MKKPTEIVKNGQNEWLLLVSPRKRARWWAECTRFKYMPRAMLEAHKFNEKVTQCMCLVREDENSEYKVLSPCGICQERLRYWGTDVQVAVTSRTDEILFLELAKLQPFHWTDAYPADEMEHWEE